MKGYDRRQRWPTLTQLWGIVTVALVALRVQMTPITPNDFWWHLAMGRTILRTGHIPRVDLWSFTRYGSPFFDQPWLSQVAMAIVHKVGGPALLEFVQALLVAAGFGLLYRACRKRGLAPPVATVLTLSGALVAMDNWQIRPQTYVLPLFIASLVLLDAWYHGERPALAWLVPIMALWVNLHGSFVLLLGMCGIYVAGATIERLLHRSSANPQPSLRTLSAWSMAVVAATFLNPRGIQVWLYVASLIGNRAVSTLVTEWASPISHPLEPMTIIFWLSMMCFIALLVLRRRRLPVTHMFLSLAFASMALQSGRNIIWFGSVAALVAAPLLAPSLQRKQALRREVVLLNRMIAAFLGLLLTLTVPWWKETIGLPPKLGSLLGQGTPVQAAVRLKQLPDRPKHLFNEMGFGSYLMWAIPDQRIFADPRIELYPVQQWLDYIALGRGQRFEELSQLYSIDGWLVDPTVQSKLVAVLDTSPHWRRIFSAADGVYFGPSPAPAAAGHP
ncbi:MAG: hypothetical protein NVS4B8_17030 [Herpetosiphon sp.]